MKPRPLPLLEVFLELRRREFPLGISDYVTALRALDAGLGFGGPGDWRDEVLFLCQTLWAKSLAEREQVRDAVERVMPTPASDDDVHIAEHGEPARVEPPLSPDPSRTTGTVTAPGTLSPSRLPPAARQPAAPAPEQPAVDSMRDARQRALAILAVPDRAPETWRFSTRFDLAGAPPVSRRHMHRAWRHYRRMARTGAATEFDAAASLRTLARDGVLARPVFVPRRTNQARALLLVDTDGSMQPFRYITRELLDAACHSGLSRVDVRWFHDSPFGTVYRDRDRNRALTLEDAARPFIDAGVLIWSDAGAARGSHDVSRVDDSCSMIETLRRFTPAIAWLNPVPAERWTGTAAGSIRQKSGVAMFQLDRRGLEAAIDAMRGLVR